MLAMKEFSCKCNSSYRSLKAHRATPARNKSTPYDIAYQTSSTMPQRSFRVHAELQANLALLTSPMVPCGAS